MSLFNELKRRNVFKVAAAYLIVAWLIMQAGDTLAPALHLPDWINSALAFFLILGFPLAVIFAWAFELTPEGIKREREVDRNRSITHQTGQKLNYTIIALLVVALGYMTWDKFTKPAPKPAGGGAQNVAAQNGTTGAPSIAVLPFINMSEDASNGYFSDGLTEELLNVLAKIKELQVAGRTSSFAFKGKNEDLRAIGEKLNVKSILEGSVRKDELRNRVRITAQLINASNGYHLWSETYDRDLDDIFAIQEEIARKVASALKVTLLGEDEARISAQTTTGQGAYDLYLRGLQQLNTTTFASLKQAAKSFEAALGQDPGYTPARLKLAQTWLDMAFTGAVPNAEAKAKARPLLQQVLEREPDNSDAHVLEARVLSNVFDTDTDAGRREFDLALRSNPRNVEALRGMGRLLFYGSELQKGLDYLHEAERIDPYSVAVLWDLCAANAFMLQTQAVEAYAKRIGEIQPANPNRYWALGMANQVSGNLAKALDYQLKANQFDPNDYELKAGIASLWISLGDPEKAEQWAQKADATGADQPTPIVTRVELYQYREQYGLAADLAQRALERKLDNRMSSDVVLRHAYVSYLVSRGEVKRAIDFYRRQFPVAFLSPPDLDPGSPRKLFLSIDIAALLKLQDPTSAEAKELLDIAERKLQAWDPRFLPAQRALAQAAIAALRGDRQGALGQLDEAYAKGLRFRWRTTLASNIAFNGLRSDPAYKRLVARLEEDMQRQREEAYRLPGVGP